MRAKFGIWVWVNIEPPEIPCFHLPGAAAWTPRSSSFCRAAMAHCSSSSWFQFISSLNLRSQPSDALPKAPTLPNSGLQALTPSRDWLQHSEPSDPSLSLLKEAISTHTSPPSHPTNVRLASVCFCAKLTLKEKKAPGKSWTR